MSPSPITDGSKKLMSNRVEVLNVYNSSLFGRAVSSYSIVYKYLSEALETFYHHQFYKR